MSIGHSIMMLVKFQTSANQKHWIWSCDESLLCNPWLPLLGDEVIVGYRNWPRYGLRWSGWYCNREQHELCRPSRGRAGRHNECCSGLQYQPRQRRPYKWSISILPRSQFTKSKGNLDIRRLVPLFVPIGVCVTTHDDGTASDVTIGMWRHNQQVTNHERNGKPWFSLPK